MFTSKIRRATVTHADLRYMGSLTVNLDLMEAADLLPGDRIIPIGDHPAEAQSDGVGAAPSAVRSAAGAAIA